MSNNKLILGLIFHSKDEKRIDLGRICKGIEKVEEWKIKHIFGNIEIQFSSQVDEVIIENQGSVFFYRAFEKEHISSEELKSMWNDALKLINELNLNVIYENEIDISIHAENPKETYERNKRPIEEFSQNILRNFSLSVRSDKASALATITPVPEAIPFKVLGGRNKVLG
ncbi:hypothetical protein C5S31_01680 [ANME-1 cluster archaeon GoMg2]|nr:hypothetical protein [ANME-1 cluster archaeon GoMg2]